MSTEDEDTKPRAQPTDHVQYFVLDQVDADVFAHAPERVTTERPAARTFAEIMAARRAAAAAATDDEEPPK
jgi:hypothetical protein